MQLLPQCIQMRVQEGAGKLDGHELVLLPRQALPDQPLGALPVESHTQWRDVHPGAAPFNKAFAG